jgi:hypothetical protein
MAIKHTAMQLYFEMLKLYDKNVDFEMNYFFTFGRI